MKSCRDTFNNRNDSTLKLAPTDNILARSNCAGYFIRREHQIEGINPANFCKTRRLEAMSNGHGPESSSSTLNGTVDQKSSQHVSPSDGNSCNDFAQLSEDTHEEFFILGDISNDSTVKYDDIFVDCPSLNEMIPVSHSGDSSPTLYEDIPLESEKNSEDSLDNLLKATALTIDSLTQQERIISTIAFENGECLKKIEEKLNKVIARQVKLIQNFTAFNNIFISNVEDARDLNAKLVTRDDFNIKYMLRNESKYLHKACAGKIMCNNIMPSDAPVTVVEDDINYRQPEMVSKEKRNLWKRLAELETAIQTAKIACKWEPAISESEDEK